MTEDSAEVSAVRKGYSMKVLLINGSARQNGNTFQCLKECAAEIEKYGIETEIFQIGNKPVHGCIACNRCAELGKCVFDDDVMPAMLKAMQEADGIVIGSPTYYAGPSGALCAVLDRAFYSAQKTLKYKPSAAVAVCRRSGGTANIDRLQKYFTINEMPVINSRYWNVVHGRGEGDALRDEEGMQIMRVLGKNMAAAVLRMDTKTWPPMEEQLVLTHFVR